MKIYILILLAALLLISPKLDAKESFFYMGDGQIKICKGMNCRLQRIKFRDIDGRYSMEGLKKLNSIYGTDWTNKEDRMSLRLIELLDFLEDHFRGKGVRITSGYRSPTYNEGLRKKGKLAASSSLHMDAEATDIIMAGVSSEKISKYLIPKECCGVGYYHGATIHIDTGPPRFWDEKTSGTEKKEPPQNKFISLKTKSDIYNVGEKIGLKFSRVNDYPIGVKDQMDLLCTDGNRVIKHYLTPSFSDTAQGDSCLKLKNRTEARSIFTETGHVKFRKKELTCRVRAYFCKPKTEKMPKFADSNPVVIKK